MDAEASATIARGRKHPNIIPMDKGSVIQETFLGRNDSWGPELQS